VGDKKPYDVASRFQEVARRAREQQAGGGKPAGPPRPAAPAPAGPAEPFGALPRLPDRPRLNLPPRPQPRPLPSEWGGVRGRPLPTGSVLDVQRSLESPGPAIQALRGSLRR
jgi:hypothetical protein